MALPAAECWSCVARSTVERTLAPLVASLSDEWQVAVACVSRTTHIAQSSRRGRRRSSSTRRARHHSYAPLWSSALSAAALAAPVARIAIPLSSCSNAPVVSGTRSIARLTLYEYARTTWVLGSAPHSQRTRRSQTQRTAPIRSPLHPTCCRHHHTTHHILPSNTISSHTSPPLCRSTIATAPSLLRPPCSPLACQHHAAEHCRSAFYAL